VIPLTVIFVVLSTDRAPTLQFRNATRQVLHSWSLELARAIIQLIVPSFFKRWTLLTRQQQQQTLLLTPPTSCTTPVKKTRRRSLGKCILSCVLPRFLCRNAIPLTVILVVLSTDRAPTLQFRNATRQVLHSLSSELARAVIQQTDCHHIVLSLFER
jgi:hypothetical protein